MREKIFKKEMMQTGSATPFISRVAKKLEKGLSIST
jgi:hypothetical protein